MARGSTGSRSTGGSGRSQGQNTSLEIGENEEGETEISSGGVGTEIGGGRNNSVNPAGASPFSPSNSGARSPSSGGIDLGKGGRGIDLGKDGAPDLGKKPPGRSPIGIEIGSSPAGNLGIGVSVPLGASPFQVRGGGIIDPNTGQVVGGSVGLGVGLGPLGANVDVGVDEGGCIQFVTIGVGPFSRTFQKNVCKPNEPNRPSSPSPSPSPGNDPGNPPVGCTYWLLYAQNSKNKYIYYPANHFHQGFQAQFQFHSIGGKVPGLSSGVTATGGGSDMVTVSSSSMTKTGKAVLSGGSTIPFLPNFNYGKNLSEYNYENAVPFEAEFTQVHFVFRSANAGFPAGTVVISHGYRTSNGTESAFGLPPSPYTCVLHYLTTCNPGITPPPLGGSSPSPKPSPLPNTPPKKNSMDDACCQYLAALLQQILILLGQPLDKDGGIAEAKKGEFFPLEIKRVATPKDPKDPKKTEKVNFNNYYDLLTYVLNQGINLDVALDPQGYNAAPIENGRKFMNPEYERPTDISLKENKEPDKDKKGQKRELEIGKDVGFVSALAEQRYILDALSRFEYLFPAGELVDAKISKELLIPGQKGELKIFNLIHAYEIQMQYLSAILGDPREQIIIKDANPAKPGDQGVKYGHQSISHLIRELFKFSLDTAGDVDALMMMGLRDFRTNLANRIQIVQIAEIVEALLEDSGMLEEQRYKPLRLEGDPYAGQYVEGKGFEPQPELDADTEEATEKILARTLNNFTMKVKVSTRSPKEKADIRDLIVQLAKHIERQNAIPATETAIQDKINNVEFGVALDRALNRQDIKAAQAQSRPRTRKKGKK